jgi:cation:H+ antiporter
VVSLGTTSPEAVVSVKAAWQGDPGLALGNGIGSIICNTALIFGICCLIKPLPINRFVLNRHGLIKLGAGVLLVIVSLIAWAVAGSIQEAVLGRWVGLLFLALLIIYMYLSVRWSRQHPEIVEGVGTLAPDAPPLPAKRKLARAFLDLALLAFGLGLVVGGSEVLIGSVKVIATRANIPQSVIAVTLVAFGTSLPELVTALVSIAKGHSELLVGNVVGANILNVLFVVGASAVAAPLRVGIEFFVLFFPAMLVVQILFRLFSRYSGDTFKRWYGIPLLAVYVIVTLLSLVYGLRV